MTFEDNIADKGLIQIFKETLIKNFVNGHGRASRREYWFFQLAICIIFFIASLIAGLFAAVAGPQSAISGLPIILIAIFAFTIIIPMICLSIRRLHDAGYSGWFFLLSIVPLLSIVLLIFYLMPSQEGTNKYGPNPYETADYNSQQAGTNLKANPAFNTPNLDSKATPADAASTTKNNMPDYKV